ncbi:MAG TPA: ABC transporter permease [Candidatus Acidoferrales bacterium]
MPSAPRPHIHSSFTLLESLWTDFGYAARLMRKQPGFTAVAVLTLALGIGATTAIFSLVEGVLLRPLPYPQPERLVRIWDSHPGKGIARTGSASGNIRDWRERAESFAGLAAWYSMGRTLVAQDRVEVILVAQVTEDFFNVLGVRPLLGHTFTPEETARSSFSSAAAPTGADPVMILGYRLWRDAFGGDPDIVGRAVSLERRSFRIVGVMPQGFHSPGAQEQAWIPWTIAESPFRDQRYLTAAARLKPGVTLAQAQSEMSAIAADLAAAFPEPNQGWQVQVVPLAADVVADARLALLVLLAGVGCVLLIACGNVAGLQLVRAAGRGRETAVRLALGASPRRLLRQHLVEGALLAAAGGGLGITLAAWGLTILKALAVQIPRVEEVGLSLAALGLALGLVTLAAVVCGSAPALLQPRGGLALTLQREGTRGTPSRGSQRLRGVLVAGQVALAVVLLAGAGLLVRSFLELHRVDVGFNARNVLVSPIFLDAQQYPTSEKVRAYYAELMARLTALPGVVSAGGATALPSSPLGPDFARPVWAEGRQRRDDERHADVRMATAGYLETMGMRVVRGRAFTIADTPDSVRVVMVNEALARRLWPGEDAVGQRLVVDYSTAGTYPYEVVGVVGDVRFYGFRSEPREEIYLSHAQRSYLILNVAVRTAGDPQAMIPEVRRILRTLDPEKPAQSILLLEDLLGRTVARDRLAMLLLGGFASTALLLAMLGIYGVMAQRAGQRVHEFGIRMALGAERTHIVRLVAAQGLRLTLAGLAAGLMGAVWLTGLVEGMLFGVRPSDPMTFAVVIVVLVAAALTACALPALRAGRTDPAVALRDE